MYDRDPTTASGRAPRSPRRPVTSTIRIHGGSSATIATIRPIEAESWSSGSFVTVDRAMIGAPSAPNDTGALLAMAATRMASSSTTPRPTRIGAITAHG